MFAESKCVKCEQHCFPNIQRSQLKRESHGVVGRTLMCSLRCHSSFLLVLEVMLQFSVSVSHTEKMLKEVSLLRGGPLHIRPAQLRNPTLFLGKALWPRPSRAPNPCSWFGSHGQQLVQCTVHPFHGLPKTRPPFLSHGHHQNTQFLKQIRSSTATPNARTSPSLLISTPLLRSHVPYPSANGMQLDVGNAAQTRAVFAGLLAFCQHPTFALHPPCRNHEPPFVNPHSRNAVLERNRWRVEKSTKNT